MPDIHSHADLPALSTNSKLLATAEGVTQTHSTMVLGPARAADSPPADGTLILGGPARTPVVRNEAAKTLQEAIEAAKAGNTPLARLHLDRAIQSNPDNPECWLWFAWTADSPAAAISALQTARRLAPHDPLIEQGLAWARGLESRDAGRRTATTRTAVPPAAAVFPETAKTKVPGPLPRDESALLPPPAAESRPDGETGAYPPDGVETGTPVVTAADVTAQSTSAHDGVPQTADEVPAGPPTILAVDDSPTIRKLVTMTLSKCGYHVVTAPDGAQALETIKTCSPSLVLLDINMPHINGYQLCKLLKKHEKTRSIPVIMLSGKDGMFDKYRGRHCGCDDYITKPFETSHLVQKVSAHLTRTAAK